MHLLHPCKATVHPPTHTNASRWSRPHKTHCKAGPSTLGCFGRASRAACTCFERVTQRTPTHTQKRKQVVQARQDTLDCWSISLRVPRQDLPSRLPHCIAPLPKEPLRSTGLFWNYLSVSCISSLSSFVGRLCTCTHTYAHTHAHTLTHTRACIHTHTLTHTRACIHTHTHTRLHTHAHAYTHTRTRTRTQVPLPRTLFHREALISETAAASLQ